jgi:type II secretory pathway pseudopilin PulG
MAAPRRRSHHRCMRPRLRSGTTILELVCFLGLLGILITLASPRYTHARSVFAVRAARDAIVAAAARTRAHAVRHGGADLMVDASAGTLRIVSRDRAIDEVSTIPRALDTRIRFDGTRTAATISYDGLGIGRLASRTITLSHGTVAGGVTFSAYGRPRLW